MFTDVNSVVQFILVSHSFSLTMEEGEKEDFIKESNISPACIWKRESVGGKNGKGV